MDQEPLSETIILDYCQQCNSETSQQLYYSCCFEPACQKCYSGFHFLQCKKLIPTNHCRLQLQKNSMPHCDRCNSKIKGKIFFCAHCRNACLCRDCSQAIHKKGKFAAHFVKQISVKSKINIFQCPDHKKTRKYLSEKGQFVCPECVSEHKLKRVKNIEEENPEENKERIFFSTSYLNSKISEHFNFWADLRSKLEAQYSKLKDQLQEKYQQNLSLLSRIEKTDLDIMREIKQKCEKAEKQSTKLWLDGPSETMKARLSILNDELLKQKKILHSTEASSYKLNTVEFDKFQNLLKNFNLQRIKGKEEEDKENRSSCRRSNSKMTHNPNLSCSRRSISKSVQKDDLRPSIKNIGKNPSQTNNSTNNSSSKKPYQRTNSIVCSKVEEMEPTILNFDLKESNQSRINFLSAKTEADINKTIESQSSISNSNILCRQSLKRKADFFDIRERMRKPSMVNNRFTKK